MIDWLFDSRLIDEMTYEQTENEWMIVGMMSNIVSAFSMTVLRAKNDFGERNFFFM